MGMRKPATLHQRLGRRKAAQKKVAGALRTPYKIAPLKQKTMEDIKPTAASTAKKQKPKKPSMKKMKRS